MAVNHQKTDRPPRGEILVEEVFLDQCYPEKAAEPYIEKMSYFVDEWCIDLVTVGIGGEDRDKGLEELHQWAVKSPYFAVALVDGLFWRQEDPVSFEEFIVGMYGRSKKIQDLIEIKVKRALDLIKRSLDAGAHGCMIGDDLAYNRGPISSPEDLQKSIFPGLEALAEAIKKAGAVAFLHSCGNLTSILDLILSAGFDVLHGLAPSAGNDFAAIRQITRQRLALMGVFEVDSLKPEQIKTLKEELLGESTEEGGYILGSSEGLSNNTPIVPLGPSTLPDHFGLRGFAPVAPPQSRSIAASNA
jgi:uroporphyrinogen decarboxylase